MFNVGDIIVRKIDVNWQSPDTNGYNNFRLKEYPYKIVKVVEGNVPLYVTSDLILDSHSESSWPKDYIEENYTLTKEVIRDNKLKELGI